MRGLSEFEVARVKQALDAFLAKRRPPPHIRPLFLIEEKLLSLPVLYLSRYIIDLQQNRAGA